MEDHRHNRAGKVYWSQQSNEAGICSLSSNTEVEGLEYTKYDPLRRVKMCLLYTEGSTQDIFYKIYPARLTGNRDAYAPYNYQIVGIAVWL